MCAESEELKAKRHAYYLANREKIIKRVAEYQKSEEGKRRVRAYHRRRKERATPEQRRIWTKKASEWRRKKKPIYQVNKHKRGPHYKHSCYLMNALRSLIKGRIKKSRLLEETTGVSSKEFIENFVRQFKPHQTLKNHGTVWSIDHIKPQATFDLSKAEDRKLCFHPSNLRPLDKEENRVSALGLCNGVPLLIITKPKNKHPQPEETSII